MSPSSTLPPTGTEALDARDLDAATARATLRDIARTNRWFGGRAAVRYGVRRLLRDWPASRPATLLDLGAGTGDTAEDLVRRPPAGRALRPVALDHHREAARLSAGRGVPAVVGDLRAVPVADRSVDVVLVSLVLHHLPRSEAVPAIRRFDRLARYGVVLTDLARSRLAAAGIWLVSFPLGFHPATRHDAIVSIRRGFTPRELAHLLADAGVPATVHRTVGWRLVAYWRTDAHA